MRAKELPLLWSTASRHVAKIFHDNGTTSNSLPAFFHLVEISDNVSLISCSSVEASPHNVPCAKIFFTM